MSQQAKTRLCLIADSKPLCHNLRIVAVLTVVFPDGLHGKSLQSNTMTGSSSWRQQPGLGLVGGLHQSASPGPTGMEALNSEASEAYSDNFRQQTIALKTPQ